jgi:hypothetical protein
LQTNEERSDDVRRKILCPPKFRRTKEDVQMTEAMFTLSAIEGSFVEWPAPPEKIRHTL